MPQLRDRDPGRKRFLRVRLLNDERISADNHGGKPRPSG